jgi:hypothetical protein
LFNFRQFVLLIQLYLSLNRILCLTSIGQIMCPRM